MSAQLDQRNKVFCGLLLIGRFFESFEMLINRNNSADDPRVVQSKTDIDESLLERLVTVTEVHFCSQLNKKIYDIFRYMFQRYTNHWCYIYFEILQ